MQPWSHLPLLTRVRHLRYIIPPLLVLFVVGYQLEVARRVESMYGHAIHYGAEIAFYSLTGPLITWLTLIWIEHRLAEKETLEATARAREQFLASLTAFSADAIISLDHHHQITSWNQGAERIFGYRPAQIIGQPLSTLLPQSPALIARMQSEGVVQDFETFALRHTGQQIAVNLTLTRLEGMPGAAPNSSLILRDVTLRRERAAIVEEERARIARDLHDSVAQTLYFLALKADMVLQQAPLLPTNVAQTLQDIGQKARQTIREVRRTIFAMRPPDWSEIGFLPALSQFVSDFAEQADWHLSFTCAPELVISPRLEPTIFRLVQESLNNVAKHAQATQVEITLFEEKISSTLLLTIQDNGCGFQPVQSQSGGFGLSQMRQRVAALNGNFAVESQPGQGTIITARLPYRS